MAKKKRQKFECGACGKVFSIYLDIAEEEKNKPQDSPVLIKPCPFCGVELLLDAQLRKKVISLLRGAEARPADGEEAYDLPEILLLRVR